MQVINCIKYKYRSDKKMSSFPGWTHLDLPTHFSGMGYGMGYGTGYAMGYGMGYGMGYATGYGMGYGRGSRLTFEKGHSFWMGNLRGSCNLTTYLRLP